MVGALGQEVSAQPLEGLETKVSHTGGKSGLYVPSPLQSLDATAQGGTSLVGNTPYVYYSLLLGEVSAVYDPTGRERLEVCTWNSPGLCSPCLFPWLIVICILSLY